MPVFTRLTTSARPGKRESASSAPTGMPTSSESRVGARGDLEGEPRDPPDLRVPGDEEPERFEDALPEQAHDADRSGLEVLVLLAGHRDEERLAVLVHAEAS